MEINPFWATIESKSLKVGDIAYSCIKDSTTGKWFVPAEEVVEIITRTTPTGRKAKPKFIVKGINCSYGDKQDDTKKVNADYFNFRYSTKKDAINDALRRYLSHGTGVEETNETNFVENYLRIQGVGKPFSLMTGTVTVDNIKDVIATLAEFAELAKKELSEGV